MGQLFAGGHAVVIGVGADLPVTVQDAAAVAAQLTAPEWCGYPPEQVRLLTGEGARRGEILAALAWLANTAGPDATSIVYFSGHGLMQPDFYLAPFGFDGRNLADTAISGEEFTESLRAIHTQKLLVLLDCCHAGGQAEAKGLPGQAALPEGVLRELGRSSGRVVIAASRRDEVSLTGSPYSQFTMAVLEGLSGFGAFEQDGYARVLDLALWVGRVVPERTRDRQHPILKVSNLEDNFALAWYAGGEPAPKKLAWQAAGEPRMAAGVTPEQLAQWGRMLANYRESLLLIEERMSEFVEATAIPLQLVKSKRQAAERIAELEAQMRAAHKKIRPSHVETDF
jgi:hypothetical protein